MATATEELITPKVIATARRMARFAAMKVPHLADEFESAAMFALADAASRFEPERGLKFLSFATPRIRGEIQDVMRRQYMLTGARRMADRPSILSLDEEAEGGEFAKDVRYRDLIASDDLPVGWELESEDEVRGLLRRGWKGRLLARVYLEADHGTLKLAGEAEGISESRVSQIRAQEFEDIRRGNPVRERGADRRGA